MPHVRPPPTWTNACPPRHTPCTHTPRSVTGLAATLLSLGALAFEGAALGASGARGVLGWAASARFAPL